MTRVGSPAVPLDEGLRRPAFLPSLVDAEPVAVVGLGHGVGHPLGVGQGDPHLDAVGRGDVALRLDVLPRRVEALGPDQAEDVALAAVLAHQRRGEAEAAAGLQVGGHPEDRRGQQVHLVVDDEAPVAGVEQVEVGVDALPLGREHLVGRDGDRPDLLAGAGVLADLVLGQRGAPQQLVPPLPRGDGVGDEDQRRRLGRGHRAGADEGLAGAAGQHDDAGAAVPEPVDRLLLVGPQRPVGLVQLDRVRLAVDVAGEVLGRPADLEQLLLEVAALGGVHQHGGVVEALAEQRLDPSCAAAPPRAPDGRCVCSTRPCRGVLLQGEPAVAVHRVGDVDEQGVRDGVAAVGDQRVDDLLGVVAGGAGVPQAERGEPVGVDVLGGALELGERRDGPAGGLGVGVVDLEQERLVALDDQGSVSHGLRANAAGPVVFPGLARAAGQKVLEKSPSCVSKVPEAASDDEADDAEDREDQGDDRRDLAGLDLAQPGEGAAGGDDLALRRPGRAPARRSPG